MLSAELALTPSKPSLDPNNALRTWRIGNSTLICSRDIADEPSIIGSGAPCLVVDLDGIEALSAEQVVELAGTVRTAQRQAMNVYVAGAEQAVFDSLEQQLDFPVTRHVPNVACAPISLLACEGRSAEIRLSADPGRIGFVCRFLESFCRSAELPPHLIPLVAVRVAETVEDAIHHGSPEGSRSSILLAMHLTARRLRVDVSDESAAQSACEHRGSSVQTAAETRNPGHLLARLRDARGCVVRLEWRLPQ